MLWAMSQGREELIAAAMAARVHAHAPFSGFAVGAAVRCTDGTVFTGCNVESASYSHTCCAERVAVFKAVSEGHKELVACALVTDLDPPLPPCGACRQVLFEFGADMVVHVCSSKGSNFDMMLADLLPGGIRPQHLLLHQDKS